MSDFKEPEQSVFWDTRYSCEKRSDVCAHSTLVSRVQLRTTMAHLFRACEIEWEHPVTPLLVCKVACRGDASFAAP
jgi:hypothetical protein